MSARSISSASVSALSSAARPKLTDALESLFVRLLDECEREAPITATGPVDLVLHVDKATVASQRAGHEAFVRGRVPFAAVMPDARLPYEFTAPVRTDRIVLRTMTAADVDDIHDYASRADVCRYLMYEPRTREEVAEKVAKYATAVTLAGDGDFWQLAIERASDPGRVIGDVYFTIKSAASATAEIGWTLHPDFGARGYMTEAAAAVLEIAFGPLGLHRVFAELDPRNVESVALCRRLGMREEAYFVEDLWFKGAWGDTAIYAILDREWRLAAVQS